MTQPFKIVTPGAPDGRTLKDLVFGEGNTVHFLRCEDSQLWYGVTEPRGDAGYEMVFEFPVPFRDTLGATFLDVDSPKFFMRWIRLRVDYWMQVEAERIADSTFSP